MNGGKSGLFRKALKSHLPSEGEGKKRDQHRGMEEGEVSNRIRRGKNKRPLGEDFLNKGERQVQW